MVAASASEWMCAFPTVIHSLVLAATISECAYRPIGGWPGGSLALARGSNRT
jgi:hypothetical protein